MATLKKRIPVRIGGNRLSDGEKAELTTGVLFTGDTGFSSKTKAQAAWVANRDILMAEYSGTCRRPAGFWLFELKKECPSSCLAEAEMLLEMGLLTGDEVKKFEENVRIYFAYQPEKLQKLLKKIRKHSKK